MVKGHHHSSQILGMNASAYKPHSARSSWWTLKNMSTDTPTKSKLQHGITAYRISHNLLRLLLSFKAFLKPQSPHQVFQTHYKWKGWSESWHSHILYGNNIWSWMQRLLGPETRYKFSYEIFPHTGESLSFFFFFYSHHIQFRVWVSMGNLILAEFLHLAEGGGTKR